MLCDAPELAAAIELKAVPHFTTFQKAADRLLLSPRVHRLLDETLRLARRGKLLPSRCRLAALDGTGHFYQGRFKSFPVQGDEHLLTVMRYVERNPLRAGLVDAAEEWRWGSAWARLQADETQRPWLQIPRDPPLPRIWRAWVNRPQSEAETTALRMCSTRHAVWRRQVDPPKRRPPQPGIHAPPARSTEESDLSPPPCLFLALRRGRVPAKRLVNASKRGRTR